MKPKLIEICVASVQSALAAQQGGAARIELCDNLYEGGTTPSYGTIKMAVERLDLGVHVMIRPRGSDFCYDNMEFELMQEDVKICKKLGVQGVVFGILRPDGQVDVERTKRLTALSRPLSVTFHRAFDVTSDPLAALEDVIETSADRLLTAGQQNKAPLGADLIGTLVKLAGHRIIIMPGSGLNESNIKAFRDRTGAHEFHLSAQETIDSQMTYRKQGIYMGSLSQIPEYTVNRTSADIVRNMVTLVNGG
ncbi:MAG: copper homeostasis protein CutC [Planctomycetes bacterium]|nr:copper homeostasis protein CutC [Planctomycetota bacterium]